MKYKIPVEQPFFPTPLFILFAFSVVILMSVLFLSPIFLLGIFLIIFLIIYSEIYNPYHRSKTVALSNSYKWSIAEALRTPVPEGIVYILEKTLEQLARFSIDYQPEYTPYNISNNTTSISEVRGFPNKTNLREAIDMAKYLIDEWSTLNPVERSRSMTEIRAKIQLEDMWLDWEKIRLSQEKLGIDIFWFKYDIDDINNLGNTYYELKDYQQAIAECTKAIQLDPNYFHAYRNRGLAYHNLKDYQKAIDDYTKAIQLDPNYTDVYYRRGIAYYELKDYQQAMAEYTKVIQLDPNYTDAYNNRGFTYYKLKDYPKAIAEYNKVIQLNPDYAYAYNNLGIIYYEYGNIDQAIQLLQKAIDIKASTHDDLESQLESQLALAVTLYTKGEQKEAIKLAESVLKSDRRFGNVQFLDKERGWNEKIIADIQQLLTYSSNLQPNYYSPDIESNQEPENKNISNKPRALSYDEWKYQNPQFLQYFSEEELRNAYQRYLEDFQN
jgi:tetratricopeptide (TPR) repeat protein